MSPKPEIRDETRQVHRIGRLPNPWTWAPWKYGPFNGRWDDPVEEFRVLYIGETRLACLLEVLAPYRPSLEILALYEDLVADPRDSSHPTRPAGSVPGEWLERRAAGTATLAGRQIIIGHPHTLSWLRPRVASLALRHHITDIDGGCIRSGDRAFTRDLSRWVFEREESIGGIEYDSRHGDRLKLWAIYERGDDEAAPDCLHDARYELLTFDDPDVAEALEQHQLILDVTQPPLPLEIVSDEDVYSAFFPSGAPNPAEPIGSVFLWWSALLNEDFRTVSKLCAQPEDWGDFRDVARGLEGWSLAQYIEPCSEAPDEIAYAKFIPDPGHAVKAFSPAAIPDAQIATLVYFPDGFWRVWGLSRNYFPSVDRIKFGIRP